MYTYFYEYKYKNGGITSGYNLERVEFYDHYIKLCGVDIIHSIKGSHLEYWFTLLDMKEIEYLKIESMIVLEEDDYYEKI